MYDRIYDKNYPFFATNTAIIMFKNNELAVMFIYLTGLPPTVLINLEDHFWQFCEQFKCRCGLLPCLTSNGYSEHMAQATQAEHLTI